jgi:hypothetical protein
MSGQPKTFQMHKISHQSSRLRERSEDVWSARNDHSKPGWLCDGDCIRSLARDPGPWQGCIGLFPYLLLQYYSHSRSRPSSQYSLQEKRYRGDQATRCPRASKSGTRSQESGRKSHDEFHKGPDIHLETSSNPRSLDQVSVSIDFSARWSCFAPNTQRSILTVGAEL